MGVSLRDKYPIGTKVIMKPKPQWCAEAKFDALNPVTVVTHTTRDIGIHADEKYNNPHRSRSRRVTWNLRPSEFDVVVEGQYEFDFMKG